METTSDADLKLKLNELESNNYYDSSVYPSNSPINKKPSTSSEEYKLSNLNDEPETNLDGNELYHNINQSLFSNFKNDENNNFNKTQTLIDNNMSDFVNSEDFTEDIFRVNQETYRVETRRAESKNSNQIDKDSLFSERLNRPESKISNQIEKDSLQSGRTTINKEIEKITNLKSNNEPQLGERVNSVLNKKSDLTTTTTTIKVNREKSFIIDLYNKANNTNFDQKSPTPVKISKTIQNTPRLDSTTPIMSMNQNNINQHNIPKVDYHVINNSQAIQPPPTPSPSLTQPIIKTNQPLQQLQQPNVPIMNPNSYQVSQTPMIQSNNKATEDFLNEIRMSNATMQYQTPISPRKNLYSNSPSQKPPHFIPPLNASNKYMSYGVTSNSGLENYNNINYDAYNNGFQNNTVYTSPQSRNNMRVNNAPMTFNLAQPVESMNYNNLDNYQPTAMSQDFDALQSRRRLLHELSSNALTTSNYYQIPRSNTLRSRNLSQPPVDAGLISTNNIGGSIFDETLSSNDMDELIDVMAKRRIAIKKLEIEMQRQHTRASNLIRQTSNDPLLASDRMRSYDLDNAIISYDPRTSLFQAKTPNGVPLTSNRNSMPQSPYIHNNNQRQTPTVSMSSNLSYPSETNREMYSTYLVDSVRPHLSAKRLISGAALNNISGTMNYNQTSILPNQYNNFSQRSNIQNTQPVNSMPNTNVANLVQSSDSSKPNTGLTPPLIDLSQSVNGSISNRSVANETKSTQTLPLEELGYAIRNVKETKSQINSEFDENLKSASTNKTKVNNENIITQEKPQLTKELTRAPTPKIKIGAIESIRRSIDKTRHSFSSFKQINIPTKLRGKRLFLAVANFIRFIDRTKNKSEQTKQKYPTRSGSAAIFKIRLIEIMTALHRVYLEPEGPIYGSLMTFIKNPNDMNILFDPSNAIYDSCVSTLCQNVEEIVQRITEFMPKEGILGTNPSKSALLNLISNNNKFPDIYFWETEKPRLEFDESGRIIDINRDQAILLLMGSTISRGLITTLLVKPIKFRLLNEDSNTITMNNLKILSTVLYYIVRMVNDGHDFKMLEFPLEWQDSFYSDKKMNSIYKNPEVSTMLNRCQRLYKVWANEYVKRLQSHLN